MSDLTFNKIAGAVLATGLAIVGLRELSALRRGRISIGVTPTLAEILLPPVVQAFTARHPGVHVVVDDCAPDQFVSRVLESGLGLRIVTTIGGDIVYVTRADVATGSDVTLKRIPAGGGTPTVWGGINESVTVARNVGYGLENTQVNREAAIEKFLQRSYERLIPTGTRLSPLSSSSPRTAGWPRRRMTSASTRAVRSSAASWRSRTRIECPEMGGSDVGSSAHT